jgi:hypothetical protein
MFRPTYRQGRTVVGAAPQPSEYTEELWNHVLGDDVARIEALESEYVFEATQLGIWNPDL